MTDNPFPPINPLHLPDEERRLRAAAARVTYLRRRRAALSASAVVAVILAIVLSLTIPGGRGRSHRLQVVGGSGTTAAPRTTTVPETTTPTPTSALPTSRSSGVAASVPNCGSADVGVSIGQTLAALGHDGVSLVFRNQSAARCALRGYPGVAVLTSSGAQAAQAQRTPSGYLGGLPFGQVAAPSVVLGPGQAASALIESTDNPTGNATTCPRYPGLLVTPPNTTHTVQLSFGTSPLSVCSPLQVHPVVPGLTGRAAES